MACVSFEGISKEETSGALLAISDALRGLVNSLKAFRELETRLELQTSAEEADHSGSNFLCLVAGTFKEMVGKLVSDIKANPEIQKMLLLIQKSGSGAANDLEFLQSDATITKQLAASLVGTIPSKAVCVSSRNSRMVTKPGLRRRSDMPTFL